MIIFYLRFLRFHSPWDKGIRPERPWSWLQISFHSSDVKDGYARGSIKLPRRALEPSSPCWWWCFRLPRSRTCSSTPGPAHRWLQRSSTYIEVFALVHGSNHFDRGFLAFDGRTEEAVKPRRKQPFNHLWTPIWLHPYPAISCTYQWSSYHVFLFCFFFSFGPSYQQKSRRFDIAMSINSETWNKNRCWFRNNDGIMKNFQRRRAIFSFSLLEAHIWWNKFDSTWNMNLSRDLTLFFKE